MTGPKSAFFQLVTDAVNDIVEHGFDSIERINNWMIKLRDAAEIMLVPEYEAVQAMRSALETVYQKMIGAGTVLRQHAPGAVDLFTLRSLEPRLRQELNNRIAASADLIKINRIQAINDTLHRFNGWATSVPRGGTAKDAAAADAKRSTTKALKSLPFVERRVLIDQGHKFASSLSQIVGEGSGAIAAIWHSHWRELHYNYRPEHKARDDVFFLVRNSWADQKGFVKGPYIDEMDRPGEKPFCRCYFQWVYALSKLPTEMLSRKGEAQLDEARQRMKELAG